MHSLPGRRPPRSGGKTPMKLRKWICEAGFDLSALACALLFGLGCADRNAGPDKTDAPKGDGELPTMTAKEKKIEAARAKLSPEDRALVDAQDYCAVTPEQKLGAMGVPLKVMIKGRPVFLCCKGCKGTAEDEPDATLEAAERLKAKVRSE